MNPKSKVESLRLNTYRVRNISLSGYLFCVFSSPLPSPPLPSPPLPSPPLFSPSVHPASFLSSSLPPPPHFSSNFKIFLQSQDGDTKPTEKAEDTEERTASADKQEEDKPQILAPLSEDPGKTDTPATQPADHSLVTVPAVETSQEKIEEKPGQEAEGRPQAEVKDQDQDESRMHVLGHDDNIRTKSLEELPADQVG